MRQNRMFTELFRLYMFRVLQAADRRKPCFSRGKETLFNNYERYGANLVAKIGKTLGCESAQGGHLFTICVRFADGVHRFAGRKGVFVVFRRLTNAAGWL